MQRFMSAKEAAEKWNISQRRVSILCAENRIDGAETVGNMWIIPCTAEKPIDKRFKCRRNAAKPFVKWVGGKGQLVDELEKNIPVGVKSLTKYAEPFVGGGALLFHCLSKYNFKSVYISDTNAELINAYNVIKNDVDGLISALSKIQETYLPLNDDERKEYFYLMRDNFNSLKLTNDSATEKASQFIFLNRTCFNGLYRVNGNGKFNVPAGAYKKPTICDVGNLLAVSESLQKVTIVSGDYTLSKQFIDDKTFVYLDPPYRPLSATSNFTAYNSNVFDDNEQRRLARFVDEINEVGAKVILSNSDPKNTDDKGDFFEKLYQNYDINKVKATRMINSNSDKRGEINELLIKNY